MVSIRLPDGPVRLYQWDQNRVVKVDGCTEVHFCHEGDAQVVSVGVANNEAAIPDQLLESADNLIVYAYDTDHTLKSFTFGVIARPMPDDYVPDEYVERWSTWELRLEEGEALVTQKAAAAAGSADSAASSQATAEQALSDLLAMLGTNIATLTDGKLTPSQIPALSINDVFPVADTTSMLALTAQRGDCALVMDGDTVTDSYILAADDPGQLASWKKLGVSYVANAGHATTADNATNSDKINNHRMVEMTESQFAAAVKDADTYYLVYPEASS